MARFYEPTEEQIADYREWVADRPEAVRKVAERFEPWVLYLFKPTNQRVTLLAFAEDGTVRVFIPGEFNFVMMEREVFGIDPNDLVECDLPDPGMRLGVALTGEAQLDYVNMIRETNGLPLLTTLFSEEEIEEKP